jgi:AcrR family transcriptional regulator
MAANRRDSQLERLLTVAARVFADKGFHSSTMRDLARATGMSLAGIYHYVDGKETLLYLIQHRCFSQVLEGAETVMRRPGSPVERLERFIHHHVRFFARHRRETKVLSHEAGSLTRDRQDEITALKQRYTDLATGLIRAVLLHEGDSRSDPRIAAYALFGMMNWTYTWYDPDGPVAPDALADAFAGWFIHGLTGRAAAPEPGAAVAGARGEIA